MGKRKTTRMPPWFSARPEFDDKRFSPMGLSFAMSKTVQKLPAKAVLCYLCMGLESGGNRDFVFPLAAAKKYGISEKTLRRSVAELTAAGFLTVSSGWNTRSKNEYSFSTEWKRKEPP